MKVFYMRPLFLSCFLFLTFSVIGFFIPAEYKLLLIAIAVAIGIVSSLVKFLLKRISSYSFLCIILSVAMAAIALMSSYMFFDVKRNDTEKYIGEEHTIRGVVVSEDYIGSNYSTYEIVVLEIDGESSYHKATLSCEYLSTLSLGDGFVAEIIGEEFESSGGGFNEKNYKHSDGIFIKYVSKDETLIEKIKNQAVNTAVYFKLLNQEVRSIFADGLDGQTKNMCSAIFLGNRYDLPDIVRRDFTRAGASHILALSGLHMSILMGALFFILKKLRFNRKLIAVILSACAIFYLFLTGFQISAARSVIMLLCVYAGWLLSSSHDPLTSLMISATALMLIFPGSVLDAGYWMSFAATLGILVYMEPFTEFIKQSIAPYKFSKFLTQLVIKLASALAVTIFATVPLIIVLCIFIKQYSFYSIISSLVLSLPTGGIILLSLLFLIFSKVGIIATVIANLLSILSNFMIEYCAKISDIEGTVVSLNYPFAIIFASLLGVALLFSMIYYGKSMLRSLIPYIIVVALFFTSVSVYNGSGREVINVNYINASAQCDMLVVTNNVGGAVICDIGGAGKSAYNQALDALYSERAVEIQGVVLSKYSNYTANALSSLFANEKVRSLWIPHPQNSEDYYHTEKLLSIAEKYGVDVYTYEFGKTIEVFESTVIWIDNVNIDRSTKPITTVSISTGEDRLTYCQGSFGECSSSQKISDRMAKSRFVIFGDTGPKLKSEYSVPSSDITEFVIFGNSDQMSFFKCDDISDIDYRVATEHCRITLSK